MTYDELCKLSAPELNEHWRALNDHIGRVRKAYEEAADRECVNQLQERNMIDFIYRERAGRYIR